MKKLAEGCSLAAQTHPGKPRLALVDLVQQFGFDIVSDAARCGGLLRDLCAYDRRQVNLLVSAVRERVPTDLRASAGVPPAMLYATLVNRLHENLGLDVELSMWAIETWAVALGMPAPAGEAISSSRGVPRPIDDEPAPTNEELVAAYDELSPLEFLTHCLALKAVVDKRNGSEAASSSSSDRRATGTGAVLQVAESPALTICNFVAKFSDTDPNSIFVRLLWNVSVKSSVPSSTKFTIKIQLFDRDEFLIDTQTVMDLIGVQIKPAGTVQKAAYSDVARPIAVATARIRADWEIYDDDGQTIERGEGVSLRP